MTRLPIIIDTDPGQDDAMIGVANIDDDLKKCPTKGNDSDLPGCHDAADDVVNGPDVVNGSDVVSSPDGGGLPAVFAPTEAELIGVCSMMVNCGAYLVTSISSADMMASRPFSMSSSTGAPRNTLPCPVRSPRSS